MSDLLKAYTVKLPCDHCGRHHTAVSLASHASAYDCARQLINFCRQRRAAAETAASDSQANYQRARC